MARGAPLEAVQGVTSASGVRMSGSPHLERLADKPTAPVPKTGERWKPPCGCESHPLRIWMRNPTGDGTRLEPGRASRPCRVRFLPHPLARSSSSLEHSPDTREVGGASPPEPTQPWFLRVTGRGRMAA